jgi:hypothetical protein
MWSGKKNLWFKNVTPTNTSVTFSLADDEVLNSLTNEEVPTSSDWWLG